MTDKWPLSEGADGHWYDRHGSESAGPLYQRVGWFPFRLLQDRACLEADINAGTAAKLKKGIATETDKVRTPSASPQYQLPGSGSQSAVGFGSSGLPS